MDTDKATPRPWKWDGGDLWHFGDGYEAGRVKFDDPHRYTGISANRDLRDSPILEANKEFIVTACNAFDAMRAALEALAKSDHFWLLTPELIAQVRNALKGIT